MVASPAMESPATTATATGRNTGSTSASAAAGYSAAGRVDQAEQHADQRGLTRPVRPEQAVPVAFADVEVNRLHRRDSALAFGQSPGADHEEASWVVIVTAACSSSAESTVPAIR